MSIGGHLSKSEVERWFHRLLATHGAALARIAGSYTRDTGEREDLVQETAIAIWRALPQFRGECSERTFVFRIAHNRGMSHLSRRRMPTLDVDTEPAIVDHAPGPEATLAAEEQGRRLQTAIGRLPVPCRQVITLALEGLSYAEISEVLGTSENNVGVRLTRARQVLRDLLTNQEQTQPQKRAAGRGGAG